MENNKRESNPAAFSIGRKLKEAREKKSLTIEQVQKQTKIHSTVLIALEEGRIGEILTDTYVRSFLKKYAQILGLPAGEILKEYFPPRAESASLGINIQESHLPEETRKMPKVLYFTGMLVLGIAALFLMVILTGKAVTFLKKPRPVQQQKRVSPAVVSKKKAQTQAKSTKKTKETYRTSPGSKEIIPKSAQLSLVMKVKEPVLVTLTKDGTTMYTNILSKGLVETVNANESIKLVINKANALDLTLNGTPISLQSKKKILHLTITRKGVTLE